MRILTLAATWRAIIWANWGLSFSEWLHTYLFICQRGNSPWKLQIKIKSHFYLLRITQLAKNKLTVLKPVLCRAWAECTSERVISTRFNILNLSFTVALHRCRKRLSLCVGALHGSQRVIVPPRSCQSAPPTPCSLIPFSLQPVTHSEHCSFLSPGFTLWEECCSFTTWII